MEYRQIKFANFYICNQVEWLVVEERIFDGDMVVAMVIIEKGSKIIADSLCCLNSSLYVFAIYCALQREYGIYSLV